MGGPGFVLDGVSLLKSLRAFGYAYLAHRVAQTFWPSRVVLIKLALCSSIS